MIRINSCHIAIINYWVMLPAGSGHKNNKLIEQFYDEIWNISRTISYI